MHPHVVIIGSGAGGLITASYLRSLDNDVEITVLTGRENLACGPCSYPYFLSGELHDVSELCKGDIKSYKDKKISIIKATVNKIIPEDNAIVYNSKQLKYDFLVIATGSVPFRPKIEGLEKNNVFFISTDINDTMKIKDALKSAKNISVIGAGPMGLEFAESLSKLGKNVHLIELLDRLLPNLIDRDMSRLIEPAISKKINLHLSSGLNQIKDSSVVAGGSEIKSGIVILSLGVRANVSLAKEAGVETGLTGAIKVNKYMETNIKNIFALGDCVESVSCIKGKPLMSSLGSTAYRQAKVVAKNILGIKDEFGCVLNTSVLCAFGFFIGSAGITEDLAKKENLGFSVKKFVSPLSTLDKREKHMKFILDSKGIIIGFQVISPGNVSDLVNFVSFAIKKNISFDEFSGSEFAYHPKLSVLKFLR